MEQNKDGFFGPSQDLLHWRYTHGSLQGTAPLSVVLPNLLLPEMDQMDNMNDDAFAGENVDMVSSPSPSPSPCYLNLNSWAVDQSVSSTTDQTHAANFESALSSLVSSPSSSNINPNNSSSLPCSADNSFAIRELIGRLGSICNNNNNSNDHYLSSCRSPPNSSSLQSHHQQYQYPNHQQQQQSGSTNNSCYSTPLNSPPKLRLSSLPITTSSDQKLNQLLQARAGGGIVGGLNINPHHDPNRRYQQQQQQQPSAMQMPMPPFRSDPGFAERAARFSSLGMATARDLLVNYAAAQFSGGQPPSSSAVVCPQSEPGGKLSRVSSTDSLNFNNSNNTSNLKAGMATPTEQQQQQQSETPCQSQAKEEEEEEEEEEPSAAADDLPISHIPVNPMINRKRKATATAATCSNSKGNNNSRSSSGTTKAVADQGNRNSNLKRSRSSSGAGHNKPEQNGTGGSTESSEEKQLDKDKDKDEDKSVVNGNNSKGNSNSNSPANAKPPEPPKQDFIHVRARRGQATDSHSLAERVRREKISERMKFLQDLVPGCNKVTGKAVMLDEIINYVQSLQRQVEFLSMKLATVKPRLDFHAGTLVPRDTLDPQSSSYSNYSNHEPDQPHDENLNNYSSLLRRSLAMQRLPAPLDGHALTLLTDAAPPGQPPLEAMVGGGGGSFWEDDLQSVVQMGFMQQNQLEVAILSSNSQDFQGALSSSCQMKIEL